MSISALFPGMEAYLDGDITINNNIDTPENDAVAAADQSAEIASDVADASTEAKDNEVATQMLINAVDLYTHVKTYGIDRTFLSIYNANGELDRMCGVVFPSCESVPTVGNPFSKYSSVFISAMEDDKEGFLDKILKGVQNLWNWIKRVAAKIWYKIKSFFGVKLKNLDELIAEFKKQYGTDKKVSCYGFVSFIVANSQGGPVNIIGERRTDYLNALENLQKILSKLAMTAVGGAKYVKPDADDANERAGQVSRDVNDGIADVTKLLQTCKQAAAEFDKAIKSATDANQSETTTDGSSILSVIEKWKDQIAIAAKSLDDKYEQLIKTADFINTNASDMEKQTDFSNIADAGKAILKIIQSIYAEVNHVQTSGKKVLDLLVDLEKGLRMTLDGRGKSKERSK